MAANHAPMPLFPAELRYHRARQLGRPGPRDNAAYTTPVVSGVARFQPCPWLWPGTSPLRAEGKLTIVERFADSDTVLTVAHFTVAGAPTAKGKVGLLTIATPDANAFAFNLTEWTSLIALCDRATKVRSRDWTVVGTMTETGTSDVSHLTVSSGPGVNFVITSSKGGSVAHVLPEAEFSRFQKALSDVQDYLSH
jgi:hypothetical protein